MLDPHHLEALHLGDIITLPDGRSFSLRMSARLPDNTLGLSSLIILGDLELLLAPSLTGSQVQMLLPVESLPPTAATAKPLCDGAASFWAPHLPAVGGAMGEILYRLLLLRAAFAPMVVLDRGGDHVFFLRIGDLDRSTLRCTRMPVSTMSDTPVARFSAVVDPVPTKILQPEHARPLPQPTR